MLGLSDARHFRRLVAGFCLIAAPIVLLLGALIHPQSKDDAAAHVAVVADNPDRYYAAHAIILAGLALFLPAILGLMHLLKQRATASGHVGGGLTMIGLFGATAVVAVDGIAVSHCLVALGPLGLRILAESDDESAREPARRAA